MNKWQKEVLNFLAQSEEDTLKALEKEYKRALNEIGKKVKEFQTDIDMLDAAIASEGLSDAAKAQLQTQRRSKIYQKRFQEALQGQVNGILDRMQGATYSTIEAYLKRSYEDSFIGTMYDIAGQGIPLIVPIDQAAAIKAVLTDSKVSKGLYNALGVDVAKLKRTIRSEISRGIATSLPYSDIARNITNVTKAPMGRAKTIVRTEGHRIQQASTMDAQNAAKARGADVVKQWDASLDSRTRETHRRLDGQIREVEEPFEIGGREVMAPGYFGDPAEDCNCRCVSLTRARWALDEDELQTLKDRAEFFGLDKTKDFEDFKNKYMKAAANAEKPLENVGKDGIINAKASALPDRFKKYVPEQERRLEIISEGIDLPNPIFDSGLLGKLAKGLQPYEDYYDVVLHGAEYGFEYFGEPLDVETLCAIIAQRKDYKKGSNIRLIACNAGAAPDGVARYISNKLHITVLAPDKMAIIERLSNGRTIVYSGSGVGKHDGEFVPFTP